MEMKKTIPVRCSNCHRLIGYIKDARFIRTNDSVFTPRGIANLIAGDETYQIFCTNCEAKEKTKEPR